MKEITETAKFITGFIKSNKDTLKTKGMSPSEINSVYSASVPVMYQVDKIRFSTLLHIAGCFKRVEQGVTTYFYDETLAIVL